MALALFLLALPFAGDVGQLGSPVWREREDATRRLYQAGVVALPALFAGSSSPDPEVRERCKSLLWPWQRKANRWYCIAFLSACGWCGEAEAARMVHLSDDLYQLGFELKLAPSSVFWPYELGHVSAVRAWTNYCRLIASGKPRPWNWYWKSFIKPDLESHR